MAKANKTLETNASVADFLKTIKDEKRRQDCSAIIELVGRQTKLPAKMWGTAIVGFGSYHYTYESGREGDAPLVALASRSAGITLYLSNAVEKTELLKKFGKYKTGGGCIYIQKLEDINTSILSKLVDNSIEYLNQKYPG